MTRKAKIRSLESHVLPEYPDPAVIYIQNEAEIALFTKADKIRARCYPEVKNIIDSKTLTYDQKVEASKKIYETISLVDKTILSKDYDFLRLRLHNLLFNYIKPSFPTASHDMIHMRILWFLCEMDKQAVKENIIDSEWTHNRDESAANFDDFKWWDNVDALVKQALPGALFTETSYEQLKTWVDEEQSKAIRQYWKDHPEEFERLMKKLENAQKN